MTFNRNTYAHSILACCGGENVFSDRERRYPLEAELGTVPAEDPRERDVRYPRVSLSEIIAAEPEVVLLPNEPYAFNTDELHQMTNLLADTPAAATKRIHLFDGRWMAWHGIRMGEAIGSLPRFFYPSPMAT
jgi:ABC-type Fe3+-hydroxamate transport system substrate-binding protein